MNNKTFRFAPAVFVAGIFYQIFIPVKGAVMLWIDVGGKEYYDDSNGILRSDTDIHRVCVPVSELDKAGKYTVKYRKIIARLPYRTSCGRINAVEFDFRALPTSGDINIYHIAAVSKPGSEFDNLGQPCDVIIGSQIKNKRTGEGFLGAAITLNKGEPKIKFTCGEVK